jgi:MFS family permease
MSATPTESLPRASFGSRRGWLVLGVAFLVMSAGFALRNAFSVFYPAIVDDFGWTRGSAAIMFSLSILVYGLLSPLAGSLVDKTKPHVVVAVGVTLLAGCVALCSLATREWHFYLLYGVIGAVGVAMMGITTLAATVMPWFPRRRALAFAILAAGFGVSLVAAALVEYLISAFGWQLALVYSGVAVIVVVAPLVLIFLRRPSARHPAPDAPVAGSAQSSHDSIAHPATGWHSHEWTLRRALKTPQFWMLWVAGFCQLGLAEKMTIAHQVYFFRDAGYTPLAAASIYSVFGVVFVIGSLASSLSDRIGRERAYLPACGIAVAGALLLFSVEDATQPWMAYLFAVMFGFGMGMMPPILFAAVADLFHGKSYGAIQGMVALGFSAGGALSPWLAGHIHDITGSYYQTLFILMGALVTCGVLMWLVAPRRLSPVRG